MKSYTIQDLREIASRYESRAKWSVGDPESYDFAIMCLPEKDFLSITAHMYDQNGIILKGDPGDSVMSDLKRQLSRAKKMLAKTASPAIEGQVALLQFRINSRYKV